jgi:hypothetical protein
MTGRELILYILENNLENEEVLQNGIFVGFMSEEEAAIKFEVGVETIKAWYALGMIDGVKIGDSIFFLKHISDPRANKTNEER